MPITFVSDKEEDVLTTQISADGYEKMIIAMLGTRTLEDKYKLLAQEVTVLLKY